MPDCVVSVILPTYRRPHSLAGAIESVIAQTFPYWELIVVDDNGAATAEAEATAQALTAFQEDTRIRITAHAANRGQAAARNTGIRAARGEFVAFLDDDDRWAPHKLEAQLACFARASPDTGVVYAGQEQRIMGRASRIITPSQRGDVLWALLHRNCVGPPSAVLCRRRHLFEAGLFDEELRAREDIDLYIRLAQRCKFDYVPDPLVTVFQHDGERVTTGRGGHSEAYEIMYRKYRHILVRSRRIHVEFLKRQADSLLKDGERSAARRLFLRAWATSPQRVRLLAKAAATLW